MEALKGGEELPNSDGEALKSTGEACKGDGDALKGDRGDFNCNKEALKGNGYV